MVEDEAISSRRDLECRGERERVTHVEKNPKLAVLRKIHDRADLSHLPLL